MRESRVNAAIMCVIGKLEQKKNGRKRKFAHLGSAYYGVLLCIYIYMYACMMYNNVHD